MSGQIFISYRRDDAALSAARLYDRLSAHFPQSQIFMKIDNIDPGFDFAEVTEKTVSSCDVLVAVIGRRWLVSSDEEGRRRVDNREDLVRTEIGTALKRQIRVIPVLVDGASLPRATELPDDLKTLARGNALEVTHNRFGADSEYLITAIKEVLEKADAEREEQERIEEKPHSAPPGEVSGNDVFISCKNLDEHGVQTRDSEIAAEVYNFLIGKGLRVFLSTFTLEQLGASDYSREIDSALESATVLLAIGTSADHLHSEWVRYEWDSFANDIKSRRKPNGRIFTYIAGMPITALPRGLRQTQTFIHGKDSLERLYSFINKALSPAAEQQEREKARLEAERLEREEKERLEAEKRQREKERLEAEQREKERLAAEQREKERLEAERLEKERLEAERRERERLVPDRVAGETPGELNLDENIQFTTYRPPAIDVHRWYQLVVFTHVEAGPGESDVGNQSSKEEMEQLAKQIVGSDFPHYLEATSESRLSIPRESEITFVPEIKGLKFFPLTRSFLWAKDTRVHPETFSFRAGPESVNKVLRGRLSAFLGHILLAEINLSVQVIDRVESLPSSLKTASARAYRKIFASYSHDDSEIVEATVGVVGTLGDEYLRDVISLRTGENWSRRLMEFIYKADVFQLFWSVNSAKSEFVEKEWRYALDLKREAFIRPTYWQTPMPQPPALLNDIHFYKMPFFRTAEPLPTTQPNRPETEPDEQREKRLAAEQREKERLEAERLEKERLEQIAQSQLPSPVAPSTPTEQPEADKPSTEAPKVVYPLQPKPAKRERERPPPPSSSGTGGKGPSKQVITFLAIAAVLVVVGLIYLAFKASQSPPPQPAPIASVTPSPPAIATPTVEEKALPTPEMTVQPSAQPTAPVAVAIPSPSISAAPTKEELARRALDNATKEHPWVNSLGMKFVPVAGTQVLFSVWDTRVQDFEAFVADTNYDATRFMLSLGKDGWKQRVAAWREPGFSQGPIHPVVGVSWNGAKKFCEWLTRREQGSGVLPHERIYRLPTDAEWSAGVGLQGEEGNTPEEKSRNIDLYPWGKNWPPPKGAGNYAGEESKIGEEPSGWLVIKGYNDGYPRTSPVGSFAANANGLYDMGGNVWQWCEDWLDATEHYRVFRGASWSSSKRDTLLASFRGNNIPDDRSADLGFRCVVGAESSR